MPIQYSYYPYPYYQSSRSEDSSSSEPQYPQHPLLLHTLDFDGDDNNHWYPGCDD